tara:strand:+ start:1764 stop:1907 length:144 start_codon:yes stop_codon:yes gene_type:complete
MLKQEPNNSLIKLWEECQITYKGIKYNLATNEFYTYLKEVKKDFKIC